jgi:hypothetical protein
MLSIQLPATSLLRVPNIGLEMRLKVVSPPITITRLTRKVDEGRRFYERRGVSTYVSCVVTSEQHRLSDDSYFQHPETSMFK